MVLFSRKPTVPVLRFSGPIGMATPLRPGLALASVFVPGFEVHGFMPTPQAAS